MIKSEKQNGFIALISAIIVSLVLITITVVLNFSSFFGRFNVLDSENKETSIGLAESCASVAILNLAKNPSYVPAGSGETISVGSNKCKIVYVSSIWPKTIETVASPSKSFTNLKAVVSGPSPININSWIECKSFDISHNCL